MLLLPETRLSRLIDKRIDQIGRLASWMWLVLLLVIVINVVMRYLFDQGRIEFEEIQWHLYAAGFLLALSFAYVADVHIRVDVVRVQLSPQTQAWIELYGTLLLLLPFVILVLWAAIPFVRYSYHTAEISSAPGGLAYRWFIKGFLLVGFSLLLLAMIARLSRISSFLFGVPRASNADTAILKKTTGRA